MTEPEFYVDDAGEHRWRLRATNGRIVADSAEGYAEERDARHGWQIVEDAAVERAFILAPPHLARLIAAHRALDPRAE